MTDTTTPTTPRLTATEMEPTIPSAIIDAVNNFGFACADVALRRTPPEHENAALETLVETLYTSLSALRAELAEARAGLVTAGISAGGHIIELTQQLEQSRTPTNAMVERAARVWYEDDFPAASWEQARPGHKDVYITLARRALTAALQEPR